MPTLNRNRVAVLLVVGQHFHDAVPAHLAAHGPHMRCAKGRRETETEDLTSAGTADRAVYDTSIVIEDESATPQKHTWPEMRKLRDNAASRF